VRVIRRSVLFGPPHSEHAREMRAINQICSQSSAQEFVVGGGKQDDETEERPMTRFHNPSVISHDVPFKL